MVRRRTMLAVLGTVTLAASSCGPTYGPRPGRTPTGREPDPESLPRMGEAVPAARSLLQDAETALDDAFGPLTWVDGDPERADASKGTCRYATATRRCDAYLGSGISTPEQIEEVLSAVLADHGWPALPIPQGGTGGWLTAEIARGSMTFTFRSKGQAEISVSGRVEDEECTVPPSNGGT